MSDRNTHHRNAGEHRYAPASGATLRVAATALSLGVAALLSMQTHAQDVGAKKLYCWNENGRKVCSDALPPSAVDRQRVEINQTSGTAVREVSRALTDVEREQAALAAKAAESENDRLRKELAMVHTFATEADLERSFRNRFDLLDESLKGSALSAKNLRHSLLNLLEQANDNQLENKPVGNRTVEKIRLQQQELRQLQAMERRQTQERAELDLQFQAALQRYRELKKAMAEAASRGATLLPTPGGG
ncbi:MAG: hypothetical protein KA144_01780 [Xanthomonadaceae bacterium]|nr:hypothetical protein [Xanthomonadaceae bacterium]